MKACVICAMKEEAEAVAAVLSDRKEFHWAHGDGFRGVIAGHDVTVTVSGIGKVAAAVGTWTGGFPVRAGLVLGGMALGWTLYVAAVTKLSEGEERMSAGLGRGRFLLGLLAWVPLVACAGFPDPRAALLPLIGCLWAFVAWCVAVLGSPTGNIISRWKASLASSPFTSSFHTSFARLKAAHAFGQPA